MTGHPDQVYDSRAIGIGCCENRAGLCSKRKHMRDVLRHGVEVSSKFAPAGIRHRSDLLPRSTLGEKPD